MAASHEARRGRRVVRLSSAGRVLWPADGITKGDLWEYYRAVAPVLVPHLRDRPFTMKRYRQGMHGEHFFQKDAPKGMPEWIATRAFRTHPREGGSRIVNFPLVNDELALLWMVQMHCIDMNAWYSRVDRPERPDWVLFDLDPPDGGFRLAVRAAHLINDVLVALGLRAYVKTSGADGIHVLVPITRRSTWEQTREFAEDGADRVARENPGVATTEWRKAKREGVYLDARQNGPGKTIASVYSVRPRPGAPVSTPVRWDELTEELDPKRFTMSAVLARVEREGDLFASVLAEPQPLAPARRALAALQ
ncbi:MAG: non-homologous end-joining DNA ligase [Actinobacteria bacterium]|nr:non-homologous end-joining DNA ligase [Actinomycetota bacterium]